MPIPNSPPFSFFSSTSLARSAVAPLLSKRRRQGSGAALALRVLCRALRRPARYVRPFPSLSALRNRIPKPPNVCYLYSDLTVDFAYYLRFFCKIYWEYMCTAMPYTGSAPDCTDLLLTDLVQYRSTTTLLSLGITCVQSSRR